MKSSTFKAGVARLAASVALALVAVAGVQAQELKIGFVNSDRVLREAAPAKAAQTRLEAEITLRCEGERLGLHVLKGSPEV